MLKEDTILIIQFISRTISQFLSLEFPGTNLTFYELMISCLMTVLVAGFASVCIGSSNIFSKGGERLKRSSKNSENKGKD